MPRTDRKPLAEINELFPGKVNKIKMKRLPKPNLKEAQKELLISLLGEKI